PAVPGRASCSARPAAPGPRRWARASAWCSTPRCARRASSARAGSAIAVSRRCRRRRSSPPARRSRHERGRGGEAGAERRAMKVLVHGASLEGARRMGLAALGLALRGHHVVWLGPGVPEPLVASGIVEQFQGRPLWVRQRADLVLGGPRRPLRIAANGWCAGVHAMVLDLELEALRRWTLSDRWAWGSLDSAGMLDPGAGGIEDVLGVPAGLMGRWSFEPPPEAPDASHPDTEALERTCERWVARREGCAPRAAAFLDRDGTLV